MLLAFCASGQSPNTFNASKKLLAAIPLWLPLVLAIAVVPATAYADETLTHEHVVAPITRQLEAIEERASLAVPQITRRLALVNLVKGVQRRSGEITLYEAVNLLNDMPEPEEVNGIHADMVALLRYLENSPSEEAAAVKTHLEDIVQSLVSRWTSYLEKCDEVLRNAEQTLGIRYPERNQSSSTDDEA